MKKDTAWDIFFAIIICFFMLFFYHMGKWDTKNEAREEILKHKPGKWTSVPSLQVGLDAFGQVHDRKRKE